jgi:GPH family glycoside/pentoside/hexuronide:cation symporter
MLFAGIGLSTNYVMPFSIVPDVVEYDFAERGVRREGVFYGMWTFVSKIGQSIAVGLNGLILTLFGYVEPTDATANPEQGELAQLGIRLLVGPIPALFFIAGIIVLLFYPITRRKYEEILQRAHQRSTEEE